MTKEIYTQRFDGEWVDVTIRRNVACCDCGLVHATDFRIVDSENGDQNIIRQVVVDGKATARERKKMRRKKEGIFEEKDNG